MKLFWTRGLPALLIVLGMGALSAPPVWAYSINDNGAPGTAASTSITAPFESFINSVNSIDQLSLPASQPSWTAIPSIPANPVVQAGLQGLLWQLDNWLYGLLGFHVSALFATAFGFVLRLIGLLQKILSWLLGLFGQK